MKVTLKDVARRAGVSVTAVSHVLKDRLGHVRVSEETRQRVIEAAHQMGYVPQMRVRVGPKRRKSHAVGVLGSFHAPVVGPGSAVYFANALRGVEEICRAATHHVVFAATDLEEPGRFEPPRFMRDGSVDGVLLIGRVGPGVAERVAQLGLPAVQVGSNVEGGLGIEPVYADLDAAFEQVARRLAELGHRRVALVLPAGPGPERHAAAFRTLGKKIAGLEPVAVLARGPAVTPEHGRQVARELAAMIHPPTALLCDSIQAEGIVAEMESTGRSFPEDYSLVVLGAEEMGELRLGSQRRATGIVSIPVREVARQAALRLCELLEVEADGTHFTGARVACTFDEGEGVSARNASDVP